VTSVGKTHQYFEKPDGRPTLENTSAFCLYMDIVFNVREVRTLSARPFVDIFRSVPFRGCDYVPQASIHKLRFITTNNALSVNS